MIRNVVTLAVVVLGVAFTEDAAAQTRTLHGELHTSRMLARFGLERAWWSQATIDAARDEVSFLTIDDESVYVQTSGGTVTSFDIENGNKRWAVQLGRQDDPSFRITSNDGMVLVVAGMKMYALEKFSGDPVWELRLPTPPATGPTLDARQVYYGALDGSLYAFDLKKIGELHDERRLPQFTNVAQNWRFKTAGEITAPALSNGTLLTFASLDNSLYTISAIERSLQWQFETNEPVSAPLGIHDGLVFLASEDFNVFCIDQANGSIRWQFVAGLPIKRQVRVIGNDVYVFPDRGGMYCLNRSSGSRRWWRPSMVDLVGATRSIVYVTDSLGNIVGLTRKDGAVIGALPLRGFPIRYGNELTDRLFISSETGLTVCIREQGMEFPTFHKFPDRQPILPELATEADADGDSTEDPAAAF